MYRLCFAAAMCAGLVSAQTGDPLQGLRPSHPRLILVDQDLPALRDLVKSNPKAHQLYEELLDQAKQLQAEPPIEHRLSGFQLLQQCRTALDRIYTLALLYRLDENREYLDRAVKEMRAIAAFEDWNPYHFLDPSEMTDAFAIGYDWLYPALSEQDRALFRQAIAEKGLKASIPPYNLVRGYVSMWARGADNWNLVCNGGMVLGALAIGDDEPELSRTILQYALKSLAVGALPAYYAPDGGSYEGPGYWHFATRYFVYMLAGMNSALGHDFHLSEQAKGFDRAGHYHIYTDGPLGRTFNYGDSASAVTWSPEMFWLARRFHQPVYTWQVLKELEKPNTAGGGGPRALDLIWFHDDGRRPDQEHWPLGAVFHGPEAATMRTSWTDPNAIFVGIKGGWFGSDRRLPTLNDHSHCDIGSFVIDAGGVRWSLDLGSDRFGEPAAAPRPRPANPTKGPVRSTTNNSIRGTVYRQKTETHSTLLIDGENQDVTTHGVVVGQRFGPKDSYVRVDMSSTYPSRLKHLERGIAILDARHVVVQDELTAQQPVEALWGMVTDAEVACHGNLAELKKSGWTLSARILSPAGAAFDVAPIDGPANEPANSGTRKLVVKLAGKVTELHLVIALTPHPDGTAAPRLSWKDRSLQDW